MNLLQKAFPWPTNPELYYVVNVVAALAHAANAAGMIAYYKKDQYDVCFEYTTLDVFIPRYNESYRLANGSASLAAMQADVKGELSLHYLILAFHMLSFSFQSLFFNVGVTVAVTAFLLLWQFETASLGLAVGGGLLGAWVLAHAFTKVLGKLTKDFETLYANWTNSGQNPLRFLEYSISASVMLVAIALLSDVPNFHALLAVAALCSLTQIIGFFSSQFNAASKIRDGVRSYVFLSGFANAEPDTRLFSAVFFPVVTAGAFLVSWTSMDAKYAFIVAFGVAALAAALYFGVVLNEMKKLRDLSHILSWGTFLGSYGIIWYYYARAWIEADTSDMEIDPWIIHAIVIGMFVNFSCFGSVQFLKFYFPAKLFCRCGSGQLAKMKEAKKALGSLGAFGLAAGALTPNVDDGEDGDGEDDGGGTACCNQCYNGGISEPNYRCKRGWCNFCTFKPLHLAELHYTFLSLFAKTLLGWWIYVNIIASASTCGSASNGTAHL